jgi:hypothetical protein
LATEFFAVKGRVGRAGAAKGKQNSVHIALQHDFSRYRMANHPFEVGFFFAPQHLTRIALRMTIRTKPDRQAGLD